MTFEIASRNLISLNEWDCITVPGLQLDADDRKLAESVKNRGEGSLTIDEMRNALRITSRSWIGVVRFSTFEIQVHPKLTNDNLGLVDMLDFTLGLDALRRHPSIRKLDTSEGTSLLDLLALLFVESCEQLLKGGLFSEYVNIENDLPVLRGRLMIKQQLLKRYGRIERLECRYDDFLTDIPENQLIAAALQCCSKRVAHEGVKFRVRRLSNLFNEACNIDGVNLQAVRSLMSYHRMNDAYREPHELAWLLLDMMCVEDLYEAGKSRCFAFMLDMNQLFEKFVEKWLKLLFKDTDYQIKPQQKDRSIIWDNERNKTYTYVTPDLLFSSRRDSLHRLPIDAKYKPYDEKNIATSDIYQTFLYAYAFSKEDTSPEAVLFYPATQKNGKTTKLQIRKTGGEIGANITSMGIPIPAVLAEISSKYVGAGVSDQIRQVLLNSMVADKVI